MVKENYQVLARKYRPKKFKDVAGQTIIVKKLQQAISTGRIPHAFLFAGPRGVGKTTVARIFAKALNCVDGPALEPCNNCIFCKEIDEGTSMDFLEIDGASNRGIEEIRSLREAVSLRPAKARYKIYLIDEVHMLTNEAFNALLKTLEEPPDYVKFIFATTSPEKILPTITSRCQRYDFKPLGFDETASMIEKIIASEGYTIVDEAMKKLIEAGSGSLRDILGYLDQVMVLADGKNITPNITMEVLGTVSGSSTWEILKSIVKGDVKNAIIMLHRQASEGKDISYLVSALARKVQIVIWNHYGIGLQDEEIDSEWVKYFKRVPVQKFVKALELIMQTKEKIRYEPLEIVLGELLIFSLVDVLKTEIDMVAENTLQAEKKEENQVSPEPVVDNRVSKQDIDEISKINQKWEEILMMVKKNKPLVYAALREGRPVKCENNCIQIAFQETFKFLCQKVIDNKAIVEKIIENLLGTRYTINCFVVSGEKKIPLKDRSEVKEIIDIFGGGEIIETGE
ncbi:MAG: DNA polymerase III subunit gamma/tau [Candidatus Omnitrophica bacterium]|nr:DNA polymerase III subunit gamma/tau [Candidatus Omnitrophota bacterium]